MRSEKKPLESLHDVHTLLVVALNVHASELSAPELHRPDTYADPFLQKYPAGHAAQSATDTPPVKLLYVPPGHGVGTEAPDRQYDPLGHAWCVRSGTDANPAGQNMPAGHMLSPIMAAYVVVFEAQ